MNCSSLLVNAILSLACVGLRRPNLSQEGRKYSSLQFHEPGLSDRAEFWNPSSLSFKFLAEAQRLWEIEQVSDKLTTIQAGLIINITLNSCGVDEIAWSYYCLKAMQMAQNLHLFDGPTLFRSRRMREAATFTAWAAFYWQACVAFCSCWRGTNSNP